MVKRKVMSQCISKDYCQGWNDAVSEMEEKKVYGQWKRRKNWMKSVCSNCSFEHDEESNYCPHCGAEMKSSGV